MSSSGKAEMAMLADEHLASYEKLLLLAKTLNNLCLEGDFSQEVNLYRLESLLSKRRQLMEEITSLQQSIDEGLAREGADKRAFDELPNCHKIKGIIEEIQALDEKSRQLIQVNMVNLQRQIRKVHGGKRTNRAYTEGFVHSGMYLDKKR